MLSFRPPIGPEPSALIAIPILGVGALTAALLARRGGRAAWLAGTAASFGAWIAALLPAGGSPGFWFAAGWGFLPTPAAGVRLAMDELSWGMLFSFATLVLMLFLLMPARGPRVGTAGPALVLGYAAAGGSALLAGSALSLALVLPILDVLTRVLRYRGQSKALEIGWAEHLDAASILVLGVSVATAGEGGWPSAMVLAGLSLVRLVPPWLGVRSKDPPTPETGLALVTPILVALKLMGEGVQAGVGMAPSLWLAAAVAVGGLALGGQVVHRDGVRGSSLIAGVASLGLLSAAQPAESGVLLLGWLAAGVVLSIGSALVFEVRAFGDRVWLALASAPVFLFTAIAAQVPVAEAPRWAPGLALLAIALAGSGMWAALVTRVAGTDGGTASPDALSLLLSRLGRALPAVASAGLWIRSAPAIPPAGIVAAVGIMVGGVVAARVARTDVRGTGWKRSFRWADITPLSNAGARALEAMGGFVLRVPRLFEGSAGMLWAWAILIGLILAGAG